MNSSLLLIIISVLGLFFGSFFSVLIHRIRHKEKGIIWGFSHCPNCKKRLKAQDLIPLLSFFLNKGKCQYCSKRISLIYPLLETSTALSFFSITYKLLFFQKDVSILIISIFLFYISVLLITFFYDLLYLEIPDKILLPSIVIALILSALNINHIAPLPNALIGATIPLSFFLTQIIISQGRWMGGGDLRIGAFMGIILGWKLVLLALFLSYLTGSIISLSLIAIKKKKITDPVPFGPFLTIGTFISLLFGEIIINWYIQSILHF